MDYRHALEVTRENVRRAQALYSEQDFQADRLKKPLSFFFDMRFNRQLRDQRILLEQGTVVWGAIIQANESLFQRRSVPAMSPAAIIYSADSMYDAEPGLLLQNAENMYDLKDEKVAREMQKFADKLANEFVVDVKLPIPTGFTNGISCYYATLLIARKHLPAKYLATSLLPILMAPQETKAVTVLPDRYWDSEFKQVWSPI